MTTVFEQLLLGLQVLVLPLNLAVVVFGTLAGAILGPLFHRIGASSMTALMPILPVTAILDPTTGLILLGAAMAAALFVTARVHDESGPLSHHDHVALVTLVTPLALLVVASAIGALVVTAAADKVALLVCGSAAAIVIAAATHPAGWPAAMALTIGGIALELSPLAPLETGSFSPIPVLLALVALGPAALVLIWPQRVRLSDAGLGGIELAATLIPAFLVGVPATRGFSMLALNLVEHDLRFGPGLATQRPKLVLGFLLALMVSTLLAYGGRLLVLRLARGRPWPPIAPRTATRMAAGLVLALTAALLVASGMAVAHWPAFAGAAVIGALAAWFGIELAPLLTGLVIGQLLAQPLKALASSTGPQGLAGAAASPLLIVLAAAALAVALGWPLITRWARPALPTMP